MNAPAAMQDPFIARNTRPSDSLGLWSETDEAIRHPLVRVHGEYTEMPGLRLTERQAARLFSLPADITGAVLCELHRAGVLTRTDDGAYLLRR